MKRRAFLTGLGAAAWPVAGGAQQRGVPVVGYLSGQSPVESANSLAAFRRGLNDSGYVEHRNVGIEYRWGQNQTNRLSEFAADLVRLQVSVIAAISTASSIFAKEIQSLLPNLTKKEDRGAMAIAALRGSH